MADNQLTFLVEIKDCKATDLTTRHRFKEKLRLRFDFDNLRFKTKKEEVGGGDVKWKFHEKFEYTVTLEHTSQMVLDFVKRDLVQRFLKVNIGCQHDEKEGKGAQGSLALDLYTIATGPVEHNLPLNDTSGKTIGRLNFSVTMVQLSNIAVMFKEVKLTSLPATEDGQTPNPYLKYGYSKHWLAIQDHRMKAVYTEPQQSTFNPGWVEHQLPPLRFVASLNELVHESIVLHVTHKGKHSNTTIGRANLLFRTLVDNGKSFKEEDIIAFKGPLKVGSAEIEGKLVFKFLPHFAQMKPVNSVRKAVHTEQGILDAMPLLTWLPKPSVPIIMSEDKQVVVPESPARKIMRNRSNSLERTPSYDNLKKSFGEFGISKKNKEKLTVSESSKPDKKDQVKDGKQEEKEDNFKAPEPVTKALNKNPSLKNVASTDDLISFTPPTQRRTRAATFAASSPFTPGQTFQTFSPNNNNNNNSPSFFPQPFLVSAAPQQFGTVVSPVQTQPTFAPLGPISPQTGLSTMPMGSPQQTPQQFSPQNPFGNPFAPQPAQPQQQPLQQPSNPFATGNATQPSFNPFGN